MDLKQALDYIQQETGILLPDTMHKQTSRYLAEKLITHKLTIAAYFDFLGQNQEFYEDFIQHVTINETYFFREQKYFKMLLDKIFPLFAGQKDAFGLSLQQVKKMTFWSAACASGEEAISLMALAESYFTPRGEDFQVYASDINPANIDILKKGFYAAHSFRRDGAHFHHYLEGVGAYTSENWYKKDGWVLADKLRAKVKTEIINLYKSDLQAIPDNLNLILLRNILIYMPPANKLAIVSKVIKKLAPGGYLLLSSSEVPLIVHPDLELLEWDKVYAFRKKSLAPIYREEQPKQATPSPATDRPVNRPVPMPPQWDSEQLCRYTSLQMNNKLPAVENSMLLNQISQVLLLVNLIHSGQLAKAEEELRHLTAFMPPNELTYFFRAYLDIMYHNEHSALIHLREALGYNEAFWVARFYLAKLLLPVYPHQARRELLHCLRDIVVYLEHEDYAYEFLLEGFHAKYFSAICQKWLSRLENEGLTDEFES